MKSQKQKRFMAIAVHDHEFARKAGIPVRKEYNRADERNKQLDRIAKKRYKET